jgi:hypothetical protein
MFFMSLLRLVFHVNLRFLFAVSGERRRAEHSSGQMGFPSGGTEVDFRKEESGKDLKQKAPDSSQVTAGADAGE